MLNSIFKPHVVNNLIRVGQKLDGGYVINQEIIDKTEVILTFGLSDEFSFEKNFKERNSNIKIFVYDHTVDFIFWVKHFFKWAFHFIKNNTNFKRVFYFVNYLSFFNKKNIFHYRKKIVQTGKEDSLNTSINEILNQKNLDLTKTLLKVDIEKDEYKILDEILNLNLLCLIIEFSDFDKNISKIESFIKKFNLKIIHLHANNFGYINNEGLPEHMEITFANPNSISINEKKENLLHYPIKGLDYPNDTKNRDIEIKFE